MTVTHTKTCDVPHSLFHPYNIEVLHYEHRLYVPGVNGTSTFIEVTNV